MKVVEKVKEGTQIRIGDAFKSVADNGYYILIDTPEFFSLAGLNNSGYFVADKSLSEVKDAIIDSLRSGELKHYPQDKYKLIIEEL